jgi:3-hydroxyacyl-CoA dehydrogenase
MTASCSPRACSARRSTANTAGTTLHEDKTMRLWTLDERGADRQHQDQDARHQPRGVRRACSRRSTLAEKDFKGLVIWSGDEMFSVGADLQAMLPAFMAVGVGAVEDAEGLHAADVMLKLRYASVPVVSAMRGLALGGGCELAVYSAKRVAAMESYIGLVEVGVGLVPGAGGLTYIARRAAETHRRSARTRTCCRSSPKASPPRRWPRWAPARSSRASWATCSTAT